ncbi:aspartyl protease family protein [Tsuneonella sp. YG55]|uniref:Aspartyl protease family protein n=1 Tax=Tsuneonella litorea TaxID=2976475 RepID=A0A9X2W0K9_9SPHN|nr:aspartyl protease family protein [Tsuneonella litorea]MCT2558621.1 aspartyl protease family protein [Tsuneonella litorea]
MAATQKWITLVPIAASMAACAAAPTREPATVAFDARSHEIGLPVTVEGRSLTFLLDAAVDPSAIDASQASTLGLKKTGEGGEVEGVGNEAAMAFPSSVPEIIIGGRDYGPIEVLVADLGKLRERYGAPMHGILGYSLIKDNAVLID